MSYSTDEPMDVCRFNWKERYISITKLLDRIAQDLIEALPILHASTGCDQIAAFVNKRKQRLIAFTQTNR